MYRHVELYISKTVLINDGAYKQAQETENDGFNDRISASFGAGNKILVENRL